MHLSHYLDPSEHWSRRLAEAGGGGRQPGLRCCGGAGTCSCSCGGARGWRNPVGRLLIGSFIALAISQVMDHWLGEDVLYEEILECVGALLVLVAVQALHQRHLEAAATEAGDELPEPCSRTF